MRGELKNTSTDGRLKHGMSHTLIYSKYSHAKERCTQNYKNHKRYYDRGIRFLWNNFEEFYNDMNESFEQHCKEYGVEETTLDRIDSNGNYCKGNCRWATRKEQSRNRSVCKKFTYDGKEYTTISEFCDEHGYNRHTISTRINRDGMSIIEAINTPLIPNNIPKKGKEVVYEGKKYKSIAELCREKGINKNTVFVRMYREGLSLEEAINTPLIPNNKRKMGKPIIYKGKKYINIATLCREKGISRGVVYTRMNKIGWDLERAIDTPIDITHSHKKQ